MKIIGKSKDGEQWGDIGLPLKIIAIPWIGIVEKNRGKHYYIGHMILEKFN